jgi:hypothetical protein
MQSQHGLSMQSSQVNQLMWPTMVQIHGVTGSIAHVREPAGRQELVATLEESLRRLKQLVADASDDRVPVADLVAQISAMERLDDRRDELVGRLRRAASAGLRAQRPGPTFRALVLEALEELRWPQNARFLEEYLWARHHVQLDSRAFAPLRRDEQRAFERAPGARDAYVAPALNPDGSPNPRWLTSSAWGLERRIIASPQTERLLDMEKVYSLAGRPGSPGPRDGGPRRPVDALLENYARQVLGTEPPPVTATEDENATWRHRVRDHASTLIGEIRREDEPRRKHLARELATLPDHARIWGWPQTRTTGALCRLGRPKLTLPAGASQRTGA